MLRDPDPAAAARPLTVLVVDDDDDVREALVGDLSAAYQVDAFGSGEAAVAALEARAYDAVVADLRMPRPDGLEVLDVARRRAPGAVRVLLTGYVDDRARDAMRAPDAPFRVGKPWYDELGAVLRAGLAARDAAGAAAAALAAFDDELAAADSVEAVAERLVAEAGGVDGLTACGVWADGALVTGARAAASGGWSLDQPLDAGGDLRLCAVGDAPSARDRLALLGQRARRRIEALAALAAAATAAADRRAPSRHRTELLRRAALGSMTSALLHDLAATMQAVQASVEVLEEASGEPGGAPIADAAADVVAAGSDAVALFVAMRRFMRSGELAARRVPLEAVVDRMLRLCRRGARGVEVRVGAVPDVCVHASETLLAHALASLVRSVAAAAGEGDAIEVSLGVTGPEVDVAIACHGDGPPADPPLDDDAEVGAAIAEHVIDLHHGAVHRTRAGARPRVQIALPSDRG